jgi:hypothetical protein
LLSLLGREISTRQSSDDQKEPNSVSHSHGFLGLRELRALEDALGIRTRLPPLLAFKEARQLLQSEGSAIIKKSIYNGK